MCTMPTGLPSSTTSSAVIAAAFRISSAEATSASGRDRLRIARHHLLDRPLEDVAGEVAAEVAVGDDADEVAVARR